MPSAGLTERHTGTGVTFSETHCRTPVACPATHLQRDDERRHPMRRVELHRVLRAAHAVEHEVLEQRHPGLVGDHLRALRRDGARRHRRREGDVHRLPVADGALVVGVMQRHLGRGEHVAAVVAAGVRGAPAAGRPGAPAQAVGGLRREGRGVAWEPHGGHLHEPLTLHLLDHHPLLPRGQQVDDLRNGTGGAVRGFVRGHGDLTPPPPGPRSRETGPVGQCRGSLGKRLATVGKAVGGGGGAGGGGDRTAAGAVEVGRMRLERGNGRSMWRDHALVTEGDTCTLCTVHRTARALLPAHPRICGAFPGWQGRSGFGR